MEKEIKKKYSKGDLNIIWKPKKCIHAKVCVKTLPSVYHPDSKPWITPEGASKEDIINQINQCPSGALSYELENDNQEENTSVSETKVSVLPNGPLIVDCSKVEINMTDGSTEIKENKVAFCRCGKSENKPYCDGTHAKINFIG